MFNSLHAMWVSCLAEKMEKDDSLSLSSSHRSASFDLDDRGPPRSRPSPHDTDLVNSRHSSFLALEDVLRALISLLMLISTAYY